MIIYLISLLVIGSAIAWSLKKAPSDTELWGEDEQEKSKNERDIIQMMPLFLAKNAYLISFDLNSIIFLSVYRKLLNA